jgi:hypothetical protein
MDSQAAVASCWVCLVAQTSVASSVNAYSALHPPIIVADAPALASFRRSQNHLRLKYAL